MMRSATAFLPPCMITFMNLASSTLPYLGSGRISRLGTSRRRGIFSPLNCFSWLVPLRGLEGRRRTFAYSTHAGHSALRVTTLTQPARAAQHRQTTKLLSLFRALGAVLRARLLAVFHPLQVQRTAHDVVTHTGQVLDAAAAHQHHRVL